jgi:hypothetical protein
MMVRGREDLCPHCGDVVDIGTPVCPHCGKAVEDQEPLEAGSHPSSRPHGTGTRDRKPVPGPFMFSIVGGWLLIIDAFLAGIFGIVESTGDTDALIIVALFGGSIAGILGSISVFSGWLRALAMVGPTVLTISYLVAPSFDADLVAISAFGIFLAVASLFFIVLGWESIKERSQRGARRMDTAVKGSYRP